MIDVARDRRFKPSGGILAVDVGNTRTGVGVWDAGGVHDVRRVYSNDEDALRESIEHCWRMVHAAENPVAVIGSVDPRVTPRIAALIDEIAGLDALRVRDDLPFPMALAIDNPEEVGVDRICSAAAAFERIVGACAIASFGTAITIDCVSDEGEFLGGAIIPGFQMSCDALHHGTALLPEVTAAIPAGAFGRNTHDAIVSGVVYAGVGALREIVERFATELQRWPQLVITGGNAPLVAQLADFVDSVVPDLCLMGVALAYRRAAGQS